MPSGKELELQGILVKVCQVIASTPIPELTQVSKYGHEGGFEQLLPLFEKTTRLFEKLSTANFDLASEAKLEALTRTAIKIQDQFSSIKSYAPGPNLSQRDNRIQNFKETYDQACDAIGQFIGLSLLTSDDARTDQAQRLATQLQELKDSAQKDIADTLKAARDVAQKTGISEYAHLFKDEAKEHRNNAWTWLAVTGLLFMGTAALAVANYRKTLDALAAIGSTTSASAPQTGLPQATGLTIQLTIAKVLVFSLLFSAVVWAGRIYRAHRHNYVVNKHRQNALSTFDVFVKAASADDQTKNAVLLQATQCIFSAQNTGYLGQHDKDSEGQPQILEIWRSLSPKS